MNNYSKPLSITVSNFFYEKYLQTYEGNRSKYIEEMFIRGIETYDPNNDTLKAKLIDLTKAVTAKDEQLKQLQERIEGLKAKLVAKSQYLPDIESEKLLQDFKARIAKHTKLVPDLERKAGRDYVEHNQFIMACHDAFMNQTGKKISIAEFRKYTTEGTK